MNNYSNMNSANLFFSTVLSRTLEQFRPVLREEFNNLKKESLGGILEEFPRQNQYYKDIISSLSQIAIFDTPIILQYLCTSLLQVFQIGKTKIFKQILDNLVEYEKTNPNHVEFIKLFQIIFYTDLVHQIFKLDSREASHSVMIQAAYRVCAFSTQQGTNNIYLLQALFPQWSLIMSIMSKQNLNLIIDSFSKMMVNKPENYFILLQYVNLKCNQTSAIDLIEILFDYIDRGRKKKSLTSRMLAAVSTLLLTLDGQPEIIKKYQQIANANLENPNLKYGAIELYCCLLFQQDKQFSEICKFFEDYVFKLYNELEGFKVVIRTFYLLLVGKDYDPELQVWGNIPAETNPTVNADKSEQDEYLTKKFMEFIFGSKYFNTAISQIRHMIIILTQRNFKLFNELVTKPILKASEQDSEKLTYFLRIVPIINDHYRQLKSQDSQYLKSFNKEIADVVYMKLRVSVLKYKGYGIELKYDSVDTARRAVDVLFQRWNVEPGPLTMKLKNDTKGEVIDDADSEMMDIIPYIINSSGKISDWVTLLIELAACGNSNISIPATRIVEENLDIPDLYVDLCKHVAEIVTFKAAPEIVWVCLHLLCYAADGQEPKENDTNFHELAYQLEFTAFISLASEHPEVRDKAYNLLNIVNKLRRNEGIMTHIETDTSTIESNVKHSILLSQFPERPGTQEYQELELHLKDALLSPYQNPWLYFLAEFGRYFAESVLYSRLKKFVADFNLNEYHHFSVGLLVIMLSSCSKNENFADIQRIVFKDIDHMEQYFYVLKHSHTKIIPNIFQQLCKFSDKYIVQVAKISSILLRTIEEIDDIRLLVLDNVLTILTKIENLLLNQTSQNQLLNNQNFMLCYLTILYFWLDTDDKKINEEIWNADRKLRVLELLTSILSNTSSEKLKLYSSQALIALVKLPPFKGINIQDHIFKQMIWAEEHDFKVLQHIVENNVSQFFDHYVHASYEETDLSDYYFSALCRKVLAVSEDNDNFASDPYFEFIFKKIDILFLLGMYKVKVNNLIAPDFLTNLAKLYLKVFSKKLLTAFQKEIQQNEEKNDVSDDVIIDLLPKYFLKKAESIVQKGLQLMIKDNFPGNTKYLVIVLKPWIKQFRLLPNSTSCIPNNMIVVNRMSPAKFLDLLTEVTKKMKRQFEYIVKLWRCLLRSGDHRESIIYYLADNDVFKDPELKKNMFMQLLPKLYLQDELIAFLVQRCKFSYYAYVTYQRNLNYDDDNWYVQVLAKAVKNYPDKCQPHMPVIIQYALLFHSSQAQSLFKRICKEYKFTFSRRTLSGDKLRKVVSIIIKKMEMDNKQRQIEEWAMEATRWVVGSKLLRNAYTSLVILNEIQTKYPNTNPTDLFYGICRSVSHFLQEITDVDKATYDFINETFKLFNNHFDLDRDFAFKYLSVYFDFVVAVDAYFDSMLPLFMKCMEKEKVPIFNEHISELALNAIRPIFNELESDSKAMKDFENFLKNEHTKDYDFVMIVLKHHKDEEIDDLIKKSNFKERDLAIGHFALMVTNASTDLKRRIFVVASKLLQNYISERGQLQDFLKVTKHLDPKQMESSSLETHEKLASKESHISESVKEQLSSELNKQALNVIFNSALEKLTTMQEAVDFICMISKIDPDIPNNVARGQIKWIDASTELIQKLGHLFEEHDQTVTLTNCEHLDSASNLLSKDSKSSILPFSTQSKMVCAIKSTTEVQVNQFKKVEKWVKIMKEASMTFIKGISARMSQSTTSTSENIFVKLNVPDTILDDDLIMSDQGKKQVDWLVDIKNFVEFDEDKSRRISKASSSLKSLTGFC
ncbi:hypothetical protein TVAG_066230 [Trichomonas vaginalis G3]|uniref:Uncharacterized protein n=1 Tax=Trichomonas vaginalis (strain ATCC PRA-98 / G3) TaxID=412133 RepID=A2FV53_TRIV3|nr:hypothetical protein TVAGG3_0880010 [Trichomonas vaginalis G3]EAX91218.1 hypothetical protein TVAG_066230 [Trichomonas vaginalis G3]KAI5501978.1 hypothetical protein TVAGG3_0880010 [Trichomonas vaginalis G3]|eukprot:XP_001304148.1 hypothetical protein [Trichomonas vaginalis G3]